MLTQSPTPSPVTPDNVQVPAAQIENSFWRRADDVTGFVLFLLIMGGGVVTPFALFFYGLMFR